MIKNDLKVMDDLTVLTAALINVDKVALLGACRRRNLIAGRMALANFLNFELKYHYTEIATGLNRDRTNIYHYEAKHRDNYKFWREYRELYDSLKASYVGVDNAKMSNEQMVKMMDEAGIISDTTGSFLISFKIGYTEAHIYTHNLDLSLKQLKDLFKSYNYIFNVEHRNSWRFNE